MSTRTISCEDCGAPYETNRYNTKRCRLCQIHRAIEYLLDRTVECWGCDKEFAPLDGHDKICGSCRTVTEIIGTCAYCNQESKRMIHSDIAVCWPCATDPKNRAKLYKSTTKKRQANIAKYTSG